MSLGVKGLISWLETPASCVKLQENENIEVLSEFIKSYHCNPSAYKIPTGYRRKSNSITALNRPLGFEEVEAPKFHDNQHINPLTPNDSYRGRTAPLTSKRLILYIYSTNMGTEYFKHGIYSPFFSSSKCSLFHNSKLRGSCIIHILYTGCAKIETNNSGAKRLRV